MSGLLALSMPGLHLFALMPGPFELLIVAGVVLLLFGGRLPAAMRNLGRSVVEFKKGVHETDEVSDTSRNADKAVEAGVEQKS